MRYVNRIISALSAAVLLCGCSDLKTELKADGDLFAMDTYMRITVYDGDNSQEAVKTAKAEILRLEKLFSVTDEKSDIYAIDHSDGKTVSVSDDTASILEYGKAVNSATDGCLDITVYPILKEWGFTTGEYKIPSGERIAELLKNVGTDNITVNGREIIISPGTEIDLGSLAKGYTSDRVIEIFREEGIGSAIVSLGGNVQALGKKPDGSLWKVAVTDPFETTKQIGVLNISDKAVITSGNYERYFIGDDGKQYCHIIAPSTGRPADNGLVSVTIIGEKGILCDALSTAIFVMGQEKAVDLWRSRNDIEMILVNDNEEIFISEGIAGEFENTSDMKTEVLYREN